MKLKHFLLYAMGILIPTTVFSADTMSYRVYAPQVTTVHLGKKRLPCTTFFENDASAAKTTRYPNIKPETYSFLQAVPITMLPVPVPTPGVFTVVMFL